MARKKVTDWSRLTAYIIDYFPEPRWDTDDVRRWAQKSVPAWKYMDKGEQDEILADWENVIAPIAEEEGVEFEREFPTRKPSRLKRIRAFLGRLFGRR